MSVSLDAVLECLRPTLIGESFRRRSDCRLRREAIRCSHVAVRVFGSD